MIQNSLKEIKKHYFAISRTKEWQSKTTEKIRSWVNDVTFSALKIWVLFSVVVHIIASIKFTQSSYKLEVHALKYR